MYSTKELNKNIAKSYLSQGDTYRDPHLIEDKNARHKGKQFLTAPSKNTCNGTGYFDKKTYSSDPLADKTMYLTTQPVDQRKSGFGTKDASRRDEFMSHIRTEQYRETLNREMQILEKQKDIQQENNTEELNDSTIYNNNTNELSNTKDEENEKQFLYDIGRTKLTEFNQKSHRDTYYTMSKGNSPSTRNNGPFVLSSQNIGIGADSVQNKKQNARSAATKQFYDHSHLHI